METLGVMEEFAFRSSSGLHSRPCKTHESLEALWIKQKGPTDLVQILVRRTCGDPCDVHNLVRILVRRFCGDPAQIRARGCLQPCIWM